MLSYSSISRVRLTSSGIRAENGKLVAPFLWTSVDLKVLTSRLCSNCAVDTL